MSNSTQTTWTDTAADLETQQQQGMEQIEQNEVRPSEPTQSVDLESEQGMDECERWIASHDRMKAAETEFICSVLAAEKAAIQQPTKRPRKTYRVPERYRRFVKNRQFIRSRLPVALSQIGSFGYSSTEDNQERIDFLLHYCEFWQRQGILAPYERYARTWSMRSWSSGYISGADKAEWFDAGNRLVCDVPIFYAHVNDITAIWYWMERHERINLIYTSCVDQYGTPEDFIEEVGATGGFLCWSPIQILRTSRASRRAAERKAKRKAERKLLEHFRETYSEMRKIRGTDQERGEYRCPVCGSRLVLDCGYCPLHCLCGPAPKGRRRARAQININVTHEVNVDTITRAVKELLGATNLQFDDAGRRALIGFPLCVAQMWRGRSVVDWGLAISAYVNALGLSHEVASWLIRKGKRVADYIRAYVAEQRDVDVSEYVNNYPAVDDDSIEATRRLINNIPSCSRARAQGNGPVDASWLRSIIGVSGGVLTLVFATVGLKQIPQDDKEMSQFISRFANLGRCASSVEKLYEIGNKFSHLVERLFRQYILKQDVSALHDYCDMHRWCEEASSVLTTDLERNIKYNMELKTKVDALLREGSLISQRLDNLRVPYTERTRFTKLLDQVYRVRGLVATSGAGSALLRPNPVVLWMCGETGAGKSSVLWPLMMELLARMGTPTYNAAQEAIYFRYAADGNKNWDGFHTGVKIAVIDDIFTRRDDVANPNQEVDEVIRMANNAHLAVPMAHLADKGVTSFEAPLVIWTSNAHHFSFPSRTNPEAITSRVSVKCRVVPKPEFAEEVVVGNKPVARLDKAKVSAGLASGLKASDFVNFEQLDPYSSGDVTVSELSFEQLVDVVWKAVSSNNERFDMMQDSLRKTFEGAKARAQGWFGLTEVRQTHTHRLSPVANRQTIIERLTGVSHYNAYEMCMKMWHVMDRVFVQEPACHGMPHDIGNINVWKCLCTERPLTRAEMEEFAQMVLETQATEEDIGRLTFAPLLRDCTCEPVTKEVTFDAVRRAAQIFHVDKTSRARFTEVTEVFETQDRVATRFGELVSMIVMSLVVGITTMVAVTGVAWTIGKISGGAKKVSGHFGRPQSWNEKDKARKSGRVQGNELFHTDECWSGLRDAEARCEEFWQRVKEELNDDWSQIPTKIIDIHREFCDEHGEKCLEYQCTCDVKMQACLDQNAEEVCTLAFQNLYKLEKKDQGKWVPLLNVLFVRGRMAIANRHLRAMIQRGDKLRITNVNRPLGYEFSFEEMVMRTSQHGVDLEKDVMMIEFPRRVHLHRDIVGKFTTEAEQAVDGYGSVCLVGHDKEMEHPVIRQYFTSWATPVKRMVDLTDNENRVIGSVRDYIQYPIQTVSGDCGAIVVTHDTRLVGKILGIHAGGFESGDCCGFAQPVTREMLDRLLGCMKTKFEESVIGSEPPIKAQVSQVRVGAAVFPVRGLAHSFAEFGTNVPAHRSYTSKIVASPIQGLIQEPVTRPARLAPVFVDGKIVDPMDLALAKVKPREAIHMEEDLLDRCVQDVMLMTNRNKLARDQRVLTLHEAVAGVEGDPAYAGINRKSSAGYGWGSAPKKEFLGKDEYRIDDPRFLERFEAACETLARGERINAVFQDTLKDERRDLDRVAALKTRLFCAGEMVFTVLFRMYFAGWAAHLWRNRIDVESCVGINALGSDWHRLALRLRANNGNIIAGDFANYDATLNAELLWRILDIVEDFYAEPSERVRRTRRLLWSEVVNSWHINNGVIYMWNQSNPSGCPVTSVLNSVAHSVLARYAFLVAGRMTNNPTSLCDYARYVVHVNYGDDDLWSVGEAVSWCTQEALSQAFATIGMVYTDESKKNQASSRRKLEDVAFLKRGFRFDHDLARWVAPLQLSTILEMPNWVHKSVDPYAQTAENLETAHRELVLHLKSVYLAKLPLFLEAARAVGPRQRVTYPPREDVLQDIIISELAKAQKEQNMW